ncbi:MAG: hypothetical protein LBT83_09995, partial [Tannerella sp.]|nr:hypothetical protein [Tannerella sp.]
YHILTGKLPFTADGITDTNSANLEISRKITQRILPTDFRALPEPYHAMIDRCWVIEPEKRVKRAEELLEMMNVSPPDKSETKPETPVPPRRHVTPSDAGDYVFETVNHSDSVKSTPVPAGVVKPSGVPVTKIDRPKPPPAKPVPPAKPSKPPRSQWGKIFWLMGIITLVVIVVIYFFRPEVKPNPDQRSPTDTHNPTDQTNTVSSPPSTASSPTTSAAPEAPQWIAEYDKLMRGAQSCYNNRDYAAAKREYNKALEQVPSTDTQNRKGVVTNKIADCDRMLEKERQDKADAQEKQKIAEIATILSQANTAFKAKKWDEAFRLYAKAKQLDPGNTAGYDKFLEKGKSMKAINGGKCDVNIMQHLERAQKLKNTDEVRRILTECK